MDSTLLLRSPSGVETALPGQLQSRIEPDGSSRFRYHADAESHALPEGMALSWNDADIDLVLGRNWDKLSVDGDIGVIRLSDSDAALEIGPTVVTATQQRTRNGLWTGDTAIGIDGLSLPGFAAGDLSLQTRVRESSGQATYAVEMKADDFRGDGFSGDTAHIDFFAQRLDAAALGGLLQLIGEHQGAVPVTQRDALLTRLLAAGPEITLRTLRIPMPDANIEGDAFVAIDPGTGTGLRELSRGARGNTTLLVPMSVIKQIKSGATTEIRSALELMMRLRVLKPEGDRYRIEAAYDNGLLTVNGFPVPLPVF